MSPDIAAFLTLAFIFFLFRNDSRNNPEISWALWLPVLWMAITGSRFVGQWINLGSSVGGGVNAAEGSSIDALYFLTLIIVGIGVLSRRGVVIGRFLQVNPWIGAFLLYSFFSILWSEFPFIAFKRWVKVLGHPVMALIILTDPNPVNALRTVVKRCAYLLIPTSVLFIKYYPQYGRSFDPWTGEALSIGVMLTKNDLGYVCFLFGLFFLWNFFTARHLNDSSLRRWEYLVSLGFLALIGWLLAKAQSATSLLCFALGALTLILVGSRIVNKRFIGTYVVVTVLVLVGVQASIDFYAMALEFVGRDPTLTDRTQLWADSVAAANSPVIGKGFESFWLSSEIQQTIWSTRWWKPHQVHNGYLEIYVNLGAVGIVLLLAMILSAFAKIKVALMSDFEFGRLRLAYLFAIIAFNWTEAGFQAVHLVWTFFNIVAIEYHIRSSAVHVVRAARP